LIRNRSCCGGVRRLSDRPIKLVVALAPGGPADTAATRLRALFLRAARPERGDREPHRGVERVGTEAVVRSPPDGYTLLFGSSSSFAANPAVMKNLAST